MKKIHSVLLLLFISMLSQAQSPMFAQWDKKVLEKANTAKDASYMTDEEKKVIFLCNLARINPPLFSETILKYFVDSTGFKNSVYLVALRKTLSATKPLPAFVPKQELYTVANSHAVKMGKAGKKGHEDFAKRYKKTLDTYSTAGENCSYGFDNALHIVMQLLIDDGHADAGHRKNILDTKYTVVGVSIQPHRTSAWNCVMAFAG